MRQIGEFLSRVHDAANVREAFSGTTLIAVADGVMVIHRVAVL
jgi:ABC-type bacteriocin/lantibiotic exporter with double-glycine peptidase domain